MIQRRGARLGRLAILSASLLPLLSACGGGGGGGGGSGSTSVPSNASLRQAFETPEYYASGGLGPINASAAYAAGATGAGEVVAVIDSGVDATHPKLAGQVAGSYWVSPFSTPTITSTHGTMVAGIIAAQRTGSGMMGVAFDGKLLSVKADNVGSTNSSTTFSDAAVVSGIQLASGLNATYPGVSSNVINMSLGGSSPSPTIFSAMSQSVQAGKVIVIAAGNDGGTANGVNPDYPAVYASDPAMRGQVIAVGSVGAGNVISSFSSQAGTAANYFVVAPGENITSTAAGGGYAIGSGTSFSTPFVAGAVALLQQMFPSLTAQQVVSLLLNTATDLGAPGVDAVYGHGLVNLAQAIQPQGTLGLPVSQSVNGARTDLSATSIRLGAAFGGALAHNAALGSAIILDAYDRPYRVNLVARVAPAANPMRIEALLGPGGSVRQSWFAAPGGTSLGLAEMADPTPPGGALLPFAAQAAGATRGAVIRGMIDRNTEIGFANGVDPGGYVATGVARQSAGDLFWQAESMVEPQLGLVGTGRGAMVTRALDGDTKLSFSFASGAQYSDAAAAYFNHADQTSRLAQGTLSRTLPGGVELGIGFGALSEDRAFLGTATSGAFGNATGGGSRFYTLTGAVPLDGGFRLEASYTTADTAAPASSPFLTSWSGLRSSAFAVAAIKTGVMGADDRLGLMLGQPLRVESGHATLALPVSRDLGNDVQWRSERISLAPSGREIDVQLSYETRLLDGVTAALFGLVQMEPEHDAGAPPGFGAGARLAFHF